MNCLDSSLLKYLLLTLFFGTSTGLVAQDEKASGPQGPGDEKNSPKEEAAETAKSAEKKVSKKKIESRLTEIEKTLSRIEEGLEGQVLDAQSLSRYKRKGKAYELKLGYGINWVASDSYSNLIERPTTLHLEYYVNSDWKVGIAIISGTATYQAKVPGLECDFYGCYPGFENKEISSGLRGFGLSSVKFLGNSVKFNFGVKSLTYDPTVGSSTNVLSVMAGFGNQWNYDNFTIAWDWISYDYILSAKAASVDLTKSFDYKASLFLTGLSMGWAF